MCWRCQLDAKIVWRFSLQKNTVSDTYSIPSSTAYTAGHIFFFQALLILRSCYLRRVLLFQKEIYTADHTHSKAQTALASLQSFLQLALYINDIYQEATTDWYIWNERQLPAHIPSVDIFKFQCQKDSGKVPERSYRIAGSKQQRSHCSTLPLHRCSFKHVNLSPLLIVPCSTPRSQKKTLILDKAVSKLIR